MAYNTALYNNSYYNAALYFDGAGATAATGTLGIGAGSDGGSGAANKKRRNIPPVRLSPKQLYFPKTWEEHNRLLAKVPTKKGKSPDELAQEERDRQEEELAIVQILRKVYENG